MPRTGLLLLTSHDHAALLATASAAVQISGFLLVVLAAGVIVVAVERLRGR